MRCVDQHGYSASALLHNAITQADFSPSSTYLRSAGAVLGEHSFIQRHQTTLPGSSTCSCLQDWNWLENRQNSATSKQVQTYNPMDKYAFFQCFSNIYIAKIILRWLFTMSLSWFCPECKACLTLWDNSISCLSLCFPNATAPLVTIIISLPWFCSIATWWSNKNTKTFKSFLHSQDHSPDCR